MQEHELGKLGIFRIPIPIPFVQAGGPVNSYIIEEESGLLLFDAGLGTVQSQAALAEGFALTGHHFNEVNRIVLSHGHIDHFGAAAWVLEQMGRKVPVYLHTGDAGKVLTSGVDWPVLLKRNSKYLSGLGMPMQVLSEMIAHLSGGPVMARRLESLMPLIGGEIFRCRHVTLEVHHMPGHTPGLCCFYERNHRLIFSGDHLLERVSPNPLIELGKDGEPSSFKSLVSYFESLERVRALGVDLVLPGHAAPFSGCVGVIESLSAFYDRRQAKLLQALRGGPLTVYEAQRKLFPPSNNFEAFLMLSEALGNLELLEHRGEVERVDDDEFIRFRLAR
jgi:glyoxylase-like metal-dependent hydrolase (beta-lactamase superfamily II)